MGLNINQARQSGFTIVELLIVVVVIAILAAITIVSYNGITTQANDAAAKSTASTVATKLEAYQAKVGSYPVDFSALNNSAEPYHLTNSVSTTGTSPNVLFAVSGVAADNGKNTVVVRKCAASGADQAAITSPTGMEIWYWDYVAATPVLKLSTVLGTNTGTPGATSPTSTCPATQGP